MIKVPPKPPDEGLSFATIESVIMANGQKIFVCRYLGTISFSSHIYFYEVEHTSYRGIISCNSLLQHEALCLRKLKNCLFVNEKLALLFHIPGL
jgi:hypothetical protein